MEMGSECRLAVRLGLGSDDGIEMRPWGVWDWG